jgi:hypothetical protein
VKPQVSVLDSGFRTQPYRGGGRQTYLMDYDRNEAQVVTIPLGPEQIRTRDRTIT